MRRRSASSTLFVGGRTSRACSPGRRSRQPHRAGGRRPGAGPGAPWPGPCARPAIDPLASTTNRRRRPGCPSNTRSRTSPGRRLSAGGMAWPSSRGRIRRTAGPGGRPDAGPPLEGWRQRRRSPAGPEAERWLRGDPARAATPSPAWRRPAVGTPSRPAGAVRVSAPCGTAASKNCPSWLPAGGSYRPAVFPRGVGGPSAPRRGALRLPRPGTPQRWHRERGRRLPGGRGGLDRTRSRQTAGAGAGGAGPARRPTDIRPPWPGGVRRGGARAAALYR